MFLSDSGSLIAWDTGPCRCPPSPHLTPSGLARSLLCSTTTEREAPTGSGLSQGQRQAGRLPGAQSAWPRLAPSVGIALSLQRGFPREVAWGHLDVLTGLMSTGYS